MRQLTVKIYINKKTCHPPLTLTDGLGFINAHVSKVNGQPSIDFVNLGIQESEISNFIIYLINGRRHGVDFAP